MYDTLPFPVPLAPAVVIHAALLAAVHAHDPALAVTAVPEPPAAVGELAVGEIVVLQTLPAWVMPKN